MVGGERNRLLWYRNRGTKGQPRFEYAGLVTTDDGQPLVLPVEPVPEGPDIFKLDYYPVLETVDWDHDGDLDLLAGGFITGRIYFTKTLRAPGSEPQAAAEPVRWSADGKPLDVQWAAAPAVADLDGDGDWDLDQRLHADDGRRRRFGVERTFLHYFRNDGNARAVRGCTRFRFRAVAVFRTRRWRRRG